MEVNAGKSFQMQMIFNIFPCISLHCKLVPVQYLEYEYGLLGESTREELIDKSLLSNSHFADKPYFFSAHFMVMAMAHTSISITSSPKD